MLDRRRLPGVEIRHARSCRTQTRSDARCTCQPSVRAWAFDRRAGRKVRKTFTGKGALAAAKGWRADAIGAVRRGELHASSGVRLSAYLAGWLEGAESG